MRTVIAIIEDDDDKRNDEAMKLADKIFLYDGRIKYER